MDIFRAFLAALRSDAVTLNLKDMVVALNLVVQITPSSLWGEAMHMSGLFAYLLKTLIDNEVRLLVYASEMLAVTFRVFR